MRRAQHSSHPVGENPNSGKPKVRSNLYLADFEGGPLSTVTILSSIETSTSTVDIRRSENLLSTNYLSSFLLSATHRLVRGDAERRGGRGATVWRRILSAFSPTHPRSKPCALARGPGGASRGTRTCRGGEILRGRASWRVTARRHRRAVARGEGTLASHGWAGLGRDGDKRRRAA